MLCQCSFHQVQNGGYGLGYTGSLQTIRLQHNWAWKRTLFSSSWMDVKRCDIVIESVELGGWILLFSGRKFFKEVIHVDFRNWCWWDHYSFATDYGSKYYSSCSRWHNDWRTLSWVGWIPSSIWGWLFSSKPQTWRMEFLPLKKELFNHCVSLSSLRNVQILNLLQESSGFINILEYIFSLQPRVWDL